MTRLPAAIIIATAISAPCSSWASSDAAWDKLFAKANGTCIGLSKMETPEASAPVVFDDTVGKVAILLRGSMGRGKSKVTTDLICLYDKKSGRASIAEYHWLGK